MIKNKKDKKQKAGGRQKRRPLVFRLKDSRQGKEPGTNLSAYPHTLFQIAFFSPKERWFGALLSKKN